jgi:EmrB/QacA subfamily drug resistance transporter
MNRPENMPEPSNQQPAVNKTAVMLVMSIAAFLAAFISSAINIALPDIGNEFHTDAITLSWISSSFILAAAVFLLPFGRIADIYGRKKIFLIGIIIFLVASLAAILSWSTNILIFFRVVQGIGAAMIFSTSTAIITSAFPPGERGRAVGINTAFVYLGLSIGPFAGGFMTQYMGWRSLFWFTSLICLVLILVTLWKLKAEWIEARGEKFDLKGSIIYGIALIALMFGLSELPNYWGFTALGAGIIVMYLFIKFESRVKNPTLDIALFKNNRVFTFSNIAAFINYSATFAVSFLISLYLQYIQGLTPANAGLVLVVMPAVQAILSPLTGRLSDKTDPRILSSLGMALTAVGLVLLIFIGENTQLWFIILSLLIIGLGFGIFSSPNVNSIMSSVDKKVFGVASATLATMRLTGQMFSIGIAALLIGVFVGHVIITQEYYASFVQSLQVTFIIFSILCIGGIFASLARGKTDRH